MKKDCVECGLPHWIAKGLAVLLLAFLLGCSGNAAGDPKLGLANGNMPSLGDLPPIPLDLGVPRSASVESSHQIDGKDYWQKSALASVLASLLRVPAGPDKLEWGM